MNTYNYSSWPIGILFNELKDIYKNELDLKLCFLSILVLLKSCNSPKMQQQVDKRLLKMQFRRTAV